MSEEAELILEKANLAKVLVQVEHIEHYNPMMTFTEGEVQRTWCLTVERLAPFRPVEPRLGWCLI